MATGKITLHRLRGMKQAGEKIACLTAYDASFARVLEDAGVEVVLIGDSLGMVMQGHGSTVPVTLADMIYHAACAARGCERVLRVVDMPYMSYASPAQALGNAARLMSEGSAEVVKMEGGAWLADTVKLLSERGIPVCAHLGLLPQSVHRLGGYRVQGRDAVDAETMREHARILQAAGAMMLVLECVPRQLAAQITSELKIPVIGIGAGKDCDGQVLVLQDVIGIGRTTRHTRNFLSGQRHNIPDAIAAYVRAVKSGEFPATKHGFD
ncbi:MAG TPA: 3-methyl-2-oxobutanoate hydroxymethyltransferase [Gammaproteobacteria bacterium]|nr:3-methyl-2-oxobutanoate hydroxymethyltransferase [Gammaproteobacteria bacterium]